MRGVSSLGLGYGKPPARRIRDDRQMTFQGWTFSGDEVLAMGLEDLVSAFSLTSRTPTEGGRTSTRGSLLPARADTRGVRTCFRRVARRGRGFGPKRWLRMTFRRVTRRGGCS
jgi:hypothetical protein